MSALFAADECGPRTEPEPIRRPTRAARDAATLNAGIHPTTGHRLRETPAGEVAQTCRSCVHCSHGYHACDDGRLRTYCGLATEHQRKPVRTQLRRPACDLWEAKPVAELDGQSAIPETAEATHE